MNAIIIAADRIVTGIKDRSTPEVLTDSAILARGGVIEAIGSLEELRRMAPEAAISSYCNHVMLPGFVNSHHHVGVTPVQVGSPDLPLELWLAYGMFERRPDFYVDTLYSAFEMIASGVTTVGHINSWLPGEYGFHHQASTQVLDAYRKIGMRASFSVMARDQNRIVYEDDDVFCSRLPTSLGETLSRHLADQTTSLSDTLALFDQLTEENGSQSLTRIQLAPGNLHWCSDEALVALNEKSLSANVPMHMHLLETIYQREYARRRLGGKTAVRHLSDLGLLGPRMTLGHGVWLCQEDIELVADSGTCVCHNCSSNFRLRSGIAPVNALQAREIVTALGIDEAGLNDDRDMLQEMRLVLRTHRVPGMEARDVPTVAQIVRMATEGGAKTTAFGDSIGRLEVGRYFDAVLFDWEVATSPFQDPATPMLDALIQRAKTNAVHAVYIDAELVYKDGVFIKIDRDEVMMEVGAQMTKQAEEAAKGRKLAEDLIPYLKSFYDEYGSVGEMNSSHNGSARK